MIMVNQFTMRDGVSREQKVHIKWSKKIIADEYQEAPDANDDGFWPSRDKNSAGYVLPENFDSEQAKAEQRMLDWQRGEWYYCGVIAECEILIPIGNNSFRVMTLSSAGLWGIESDAGDYLDEVFEEEKDSLFEQIKTLGKAIADNDLVTMA
jgi:hypothetical protein